MMLGFFALDQVYLGDCLELIPQLPNDSIDVVVTSPPYWGQRRSNGTGGKEDPRDYLAFLVRVFTAILPKLKPEGIIWINLGDAYNTPVNWREDERRYCSLGTDNDGLAAHNSAYTKSRMIEKGVHRQGNRLAAIRKSAGSALPACLGSAGCRIFVSR
ncbi:MAG: DNA methyltransferase [Candidatus Competibacter sp.]|nr:DNA methyltransferase [Candidatus Competibacter sp.]